MRPLATVRSLRTHRRTHRRTREPQAAAHAGAVFRVLSGLAIHAFDNALPVSLAGLRTRCQGIASAAAAKSTG